MSPERPYARIAAALRAQIQSGQLPPGAALPTRAELRETFHAHNVTLNRALDILRAEGLIEGRPGGRVHVRQRPPVVRLARHRLGRSERQQGRGFFLSDAESGGWRPRSETTVEVQPCPPDVAADLRIEPGAPVLVRDRVMSVDDVPVQLATSFLPRDLTEGTPIEDQNPGPGGIIGRLEDAGHPVALFRERVRTGPANADDAAALGVPVGTPVWLLDRIAFGAERVLELNRIRILADRAELVYELPAD